jgi:hypothetical protein
MSSARERSLEPEGLRYGEPTWDIAQLFPAQGTWTESESYVVHGEFERGEQATSKLLPGFAVDVTSALTPKP